VLPLGGAAMWYGAVPVESLPAARGRIGGRRRRADGQIALKFWRTAAENPIEEPGPHVALLMYERQFPDRNRSPAGARRSTLAADSPPRPSRG